MSSSYVVVVEDITEYLFLIPAKIIALLHASPSVLELHAVHYDCYGFAHQSLKLVTLLPLSDPLDLQNHQITGDEDWTQV